MKVERVTLVNGVLAIELLAFLCLVYAVRHWVPEADPYYVAAQDEVIQASR